LHCTGTGFPSLKILPFAWLPSAPCQAAIRKNLFDEALVSLFLRYIFPTRQYPDIQPVVIDGQADGRIRFWVCLFLIEQQRQPFAQCSPWDIDVRQATESSMPTAHSSAHRKRKGTRGARKLLIVVVKGGIEPPT
jgi:hypothetical protein